MYCGEDVVPMSFGYEDSRSSEGRVAHHRGVDAWETDGFQPERGGGFVGDGTLSLSCFGEVDVG